MDVADIIESAFGSEGTNGEGEAVTVALRLAGDTEGASQRDAEVWSHYGLAYRPAAPDGKHKCQALYDSEHGALAVMATKDTRASDCHGALNAGDVALWSVGKVSFRANADGSIAMIKQGESVDSYHICGTDGSWKMGNEWGQMSLDAEGFQVVLAGGQALSLTKDGLTVLGPSANLACGNVCLGVGASVPLAVAPIAGVVGAGFCPSKPIGNVFV